jgi:hypothetical protein
VPTHSADRSSSQTAAVAAALGDELAASVPVLPGLSAAGNPTLTGVGYSCSSDRKLPG